MNTGELIRKKRIELGISQKELADRTEIPPNAISKIENGLREVRNEEIKRIAEELGTSMQYLLTGNIDKYDILIGAIIAKTEEGKLQWNSLENIIVEKQKKSKTGKFFERLRLIENELKAGDPEIELFEWSERLDESIKEVRIKDALYCKVKGREQVYILYGIASDSILIVTNVNFENEKIDTLIIEGWVYDLSPIRQAINSQILAKNDKIIDTFITDLNNL